MKNLVYQRNEYIVFKSRGGYVIYNRNTEFNAGHTHLSKYHICKLVIDNVINKRMPDTTNLYVLESHARISTDPDYVKSIKDLISVRRNKTKVPYYRPPKRH